MSVAVRTYQLCKSYKNQQIVDHVNMTIPRGGIYGFLGPNGAGKTTVMRMLANLIKPTSGYIELFGETLTASSYEVMKRIGGVIEYPVFYDQLSAQANLELHLQYMGYYEPKAIGEALERVRLTDLGNKPVKSFSLGMKQRLGIARAIITRPELLILDEPSNGLDPVGIHELRELFRTLSKEYGMTLLISSHILQEIEQIADTIGVINQGNLLEEVEMEHIRGQMSEYIELTVTDGKRAALVLEDQLGIRNYKVMASNTLRIYEPSLSPVDVSRALILQDIGLEALSKKSSSLEEHFLKLIQGADTHA